MTTLMVQCSGNHSDDISDDDDDHDNDHNAEEDVDLGDYDDDNNVILFFISDPLFSSI